MTDTKISALTENTTPALTDLFVMVDDPSGTPVTKKVTGENVQEMFGVKTKIIRGTVSNPQAMYAQRPQIPCFRADADLTITRIMIDGSDNTPTAELAGDLKYADDKYTGSFANAVVIDVCDTTNGTFTATSGFDDATVPSGKWIYFQMDASPHVDYVDFTIEIFFTYD